MKWLKPYMPAYLRLALPAWICLLLEVLVDLSLPTLLASIVNEGVMQQDMQHVLRIGAYMLGLALLGSLTGQARNVLSTHASQNLGTKIRSDLFRKIQSMTLATARRFGTSSLITRLTNDVMQVQNLSYMLTRIFIRAPLLLIGGILMAFLLNPGMALLLLAILPLLALLITIRVKRGFPLFRKVQAAIDKVNSVVREFLAGVRVVKVFNRLDYERDRFDQANENLVGLSVKAARSMAAIQPLIFILMNGSIVLLLWIGGIRVNAGGAKVGDIMAFINYFLQILHAMTMMSMIFTAGVRAKTSLDRIGQVILEPAGMPETQNPLEPRRSGTIELDQVYYTYPGQVQPVLNGISLQITPGQTAALIGATGCGKTTLISLLGRFYDCDSGHVKVDGVDVRDLSLSDLRSRLSYVPQQSLLFTGTIEENLKWGYPDADEQDMARALNIAQAAEFVGRMPEGLQTRIGQGGVNLSGGQKQRICIARALVRQAPVLLLDDSTSAIDMETDQKLRAALKMHCRETTVVMIAQRIQSVMDADVIFVMNGGSIESSGTHRELLKTSGIYRDIFRSQMGLDIEGREVI